MVEKVLICSASETLRESAKEILGNKHNLILCEDINQCPEIITNGNVKTLLLDIENQEDVLEWIPNLIISKLIIIANHKSTQMAEKAVKLGASGYLVTPFKKEALLSCLK